MRKFLIGITVTNCVVLLATALVFSAPILPLRSELPDPVQSLAGTRRLKLNIRPISGELAAHNITTRSVRHDWQSRLEAAGIEVVRDSDDDATYVPTLDLAVIVGHDEGVSDSVMCIQVLKFIQPLQFERLGRALSVPTYFQPMATMERAPTLGNSVAGNLDELIVEFIENARKANGLLQP